MKCKKLQGEQESGELTHRSDSELAEMIFFSGWLRVKDEELTYQSGQAAWFQGLGMPGSCSRRRLEFGLPCELPLWMD
jgi:hypothetical protein